MIEKINIKIVNKLINLKNVINNNENNIFINQNNDEDKSF